MNNVDYNFSVCIKRIANLTILLFSIIYIAFWVLDIHSGKNYGNVLYGPTWDRVGFPPVETEKSAVRIGVSDADCLKLTGLPIACKQHWFGDFYRNYEVVQTRSPWLTEGENPNFAIPNLITKVLEKNLDYSASLVIYLFISAVCMLVPLSFALIRQKEVGNGLFYFTVFGVLSYPFLFTLDRANAQAFVPILLFFIGYCLERKKNLISSALLVMLLSFKLHAAPFAAIFWKNLTARQWVAVFMLTMALIALPMFAWEAPITESLHGWFNTVRNMTGGGGDALIFVWRNQSIVGFLSNLAFILNQIIGVYAIKKIGLLPAVLYGFFALPIILNRKLPMSSRIFATGSLMLICVPRGYGYGVNFLLAVIPLMMIENKSFYIRGGRFVSFYFNMITPLAYAILLVPDLVFTTDYYKISNGAVLFKNIASLLSCMIIIGSFYILSFNLNEKNNS